MQARLSLSAVGGARSLQPAIEERQLNGADVRPGLGSEIDLRKPVGEAVRPRTDPGLNVAAEMRQPGECVQIVGRIIVEPAAHR